MIYAPATTSLIHRRLHRYLTDVVHVDIYWFIGSELHNAPAQLPRLDTPLNGTAEVPWRYHFNTGIVPAVVLGLITNHPQ